jgi:hypothetical protein
MYALVVGVTAGGGRVRKWMKQLIVPENFLATFPLLPSWHLKPDTFEHTQLLQLLKSSNQKTCFSELNTLHNYIII